MTMATELLAWMLEATLASSAALLLVLAVRRPLRAFFGAGACHAVWAVVPMAVLATLLPAPVQDVSFTPVVGLQASAGRLADAVPRGDALATFACLAWACGAFGFAACLAGQQRRFMRRLGRIVEGADGWLLAEAVAGLPAVVGAWRPRIVMPADAMSRYDAHERRLMLAHERMHITRGDLLANAAVAGLRCVFWFNPLLHLAARRFRDDQELACDQAVIARHPQARRAYGEAMFKTQLATQILPLGCHWGQSHPLKERIEMLKRPLPSSPRRTSGRAVVLALLLTAGYAAWAAQLGTRADSPHAEVKPGAAGHGQASVSKRDAAVARASSPVDPKADSDARKDMKPIVPRAANAASVTSGSYERMVTSFSASWMPRNAAEEEGC